MFRFRFKYKILFILLFLFGTEIFAKEQEVKALPSNLYIQSDSLIIDRIKQKIEYIGKVIVYFEDAVLRTEILEVIYKIEGNEKTVDRIIIPTKLTVKREMHDELLIADSAEYFLDNKQLILLGNVILQHDGSILKTDKLIYYIDLDTAMKKN
nr:LptA/OstA family protein [Rickettsia endosymbiont of Ceutorhynchus assimilis]